MPIVGLVLASITWTAALISAQSGASNASAISPAPQFFVPSNLSNEDHARGTVCQMPSRAVGKWWYNPNNDATYHAYYSCYGPAYQSWTMLNSYRSGGTENVHWKYSNDPSDKGCLSSWEYYAEDGITLLAYIRGRLTLENDTRRWCAIATYRRGGIENYRWAWCACWEEGKPRR